MSSLLCWSGVPGGFTVNWPPCRERKAEDADLLMHLTGRVNQGYNIQAHRPPLATLHCHAHTRHTLPVRASCREECSSQQTVPVVRTVSRVCQSSLAVETGLRSSLRQNPSSQAGWLNGSSWPSVLFSDIAAGHSILPAGSISLRQGEWIGTVRLDWSIDLRTGTFNFNERIL